MWLIIELSLLWLGIGVLLSELWKRNRIAMKNRQIETLTQTVAVLQQKITVLEASVNGIGVDDGSDSAALTAAIDNINTLGATADQLIAKLGVR